MVALPGFQLSAYMRTPPCDNEEWRYMRRSELVKVFEVAVSIQRLKERVFDGSREIRGPGSSDLLKSLKTILLNIHATNPTLDYEINVFKHKLGAPLWRALHKGFGCRVAHMRRGKAITFKPMPGQNRNPTLRDLWRKTREELLELKGVGPSALTKIERLLDCYELRLKVR